MIEPKLFSPHQYQTDALRFLIQHIAIDKNLGALLFLDCGLGKSAIILSFINALRMMGKVKKVLIVAPLRVCYQTWPFEVQKWKQFSHLRVQIVHGNSTKKLRQLATDADIYCTNVDNATFLMEHFFFQDNPFDAIILDEVTCFKTWDSARTKSMVSFIKSFKIRVGATGTPTANSLMPLFSMTHLIDGGRSFGPFISHFKNRYFYRSGFGVAATYKPFKETQAELEKAISWCTLTMQASEYLDMPELVNNEVWIELSPAIQKEYRVLERDMFIALDESGGKIVAKNAAAKINLCRQFVNGGFYKHNDTGKRETIQKHTEKIEACLEILDGIGGKPAMIVFQYTHDLERLQKALGKQLQFINGTTTPTQLNGIVHAWNEGLIQYLAVQPQACGHGLNLQSGPARDIVMIGVGYDREIHDQVIARIHRQGVSSQVRVHKILARNTIDEAMNDGLNVKGEVQSSFLGALAKYRKTINNG